VSRESSKMTGKPVRQSTPTRGARAKKDPPPAMPSPGCWFSISLTSLPHFPFYCIACLWKGYIPHVPAGSGRLSSAGSCVGHSVGAGHKTSCKSPCQRCTEFAQLISELQQANIALQQKELDLSARLLLAHQDLQVQTERVCVCVFASQARFMTVLCSFAFE
jgi:hypothetical protein